MNLTLQFWKKCYISMQSACWLKVGSNVKIVNFDYFPFDFFLFFSIQIWSIDWCQPLTKNLNWLSDLVSTKTPRFAKSFRSDSISTFKMTIKFFKKAEWIRRRHCFKSSRLIFSHFCYCFACKMWKNQVSAFEMVTMLNSYYFNTKVAFFHDRLFYNFKTKVLTPRPVLS